MAEHDLTPLTDIMARLRDPKHGCAWDAAQTFATIAPYTIEEAYEVADAIERFDMDELRGELGDLLLQVVFHARIAEEAGHFDINDVVAAICDKMIRRHPHVFGDAVHGDDAEAASNWEAIKAAERGDETTGALDGVANALPALLRAQKIQKRASRVGFDWPDAAGPKAKIAEEMEEIEAATNAFEIEDEAGDLLFAAVNYARHLGVDAEQALSKATRKFERRFREMEAISEKSLDSYSLDELEALWKRVKTSAASAR